MFSPAPHWLLCIEPSFDINWVKNEGGGEGGQQLDPTINVTLVSQLHQCQSLAFRLPPFYFSPSSMRFSYFGVFLKMLLREASQPLTVVLLTCEM